MLMVWTVRYWRGEGDGNGREAFGRSITIGFVVMFYRCSERVFQDLSENILQVNGDISEKESE